MVTDYIDDIKGGDHQWNTAGKGVSWQEEEGARSRQTGTETLDAAGTDNAGKLTQLNCTNVTWLVKVVVHSWVL